MALVDLTHRLFFWFAVLRIVTGNRWGRLLVGPHGSKEGHDVFAFWELASFGKVGILFWLLRKVRGQGAALVQTEHRGCDNDLPFRWAQAARYRWGEFRTSKHRRREERRVVKSPVAPRLVSRTATTKGEAKDRHSMK